MGMKHGDTRPARRGGISAKSLNARLYGSDEAPELSWDEAKRQMLARLLDDAVQPPPLRIGRGATVERPEAEARGRKIFTKALYDLVPESTALLITSDSLRVERDYKAAHAPALHAASSDPALANLPYSLDVLESVSAPFAAAVAEKWAVIEKWQYRFRLYDDWLAELAWRTMHTAWEMEESGLKYRGPLGLGSLSWVVSQYELDDCIEGREVVFEHGNPVYPLFVDDLKVSPNESGFDMYDPDAESVKAATDRLLQTLRPRVRRALEQIVSEHRESTDALLPVRKATSTAFEWLVRYQVMNKTMPAIAAEAGVSTQSVSDAIHEARDLVGLTLRERSKAGRKSHKRARTVKLSG